jgi:hypothetical protein
MLIASPLPSWSKGLRVSQFAVFFGNNAAVGKQLLWEHTIYQVIRLFEEAERRIRSPEGQARYSSLEGWWRKSAQRINGKSGFKVPEERAVSEALVEQMELVKKDLMLNSHKLEPDIADIDTLEFHAEAPRRQKAGIGRRAKPTDFRFYRSGLGGFDLRIEAKVLTKDTEILRKYLSGEGLGRFSHSKEPYTDELVGGMVAYTVSENKLGWLTKLSGETASMSPSIATFHYPVLPIGEPTLFSQVPFNFIKVPPQSEVLVFHLVLEFDCAPPAR